jgi:hypothetical protein
MTTKEFERKVGEIVEALRGLPPDRQEAFLEVLEDARSREDRQATGGWPDSDEGESPHPCGAG